MDVEAPTPLGPYREDPKVDLQDDQETQVQAIDAIVRQTGERPLRPPEE